jgi:hypothetical protein
MFDPDALIQQAIDASKKHSTTLDSQLAFQVGYMKGIINNLCYTMQNVQDELKLVQQQLNSIGEIQ